MKNVRILVSIICLLLAGEIAYSCNDLSIGTITTPLILQACNTYQITIPVINSSTTTDYTSVQIAISFGNSTAIVTPVAPNPSGYYIYSFTGNFPKNSTTPVTLALQYKCSVSTSGCTGCPAASILDKLWIWDGSICASTMKTMSYNLEYPSWVPTFNATYFVSGNTMPHRDFQIINTGTTGNKFTKYFYFNDVITSGTGFMRFSPTAEVWINNVLFGTYPATTSALTITIPAMDTLHYGDTIIVREYFDIFDCPSAGGVTQINYKLGCSASTPDICLNESANITVARDVSTPDILITRMAPLNSWLITDYYWDSSCPNNDVSGSNNNLTHWTFKIKNNNPVHAYTDAAIHIKKQPGLLETSYTYIINDSLHPITVTGPGTITPHLSYLSAAIDTPYPKCLITNPTAIHEADYTLGVLNPLAEYTVDFWTLRCCPNDEDDVTTAIHEYTLFDDPNSPSTEIVFNHWILMLDAFDDCATTTYPDVSSSSNLNSLAGRALSGNYYYLNSDLFLRQQFMAPVTNMFVPSDSVTGSSVLFTVRNAAFDLYGQEGTRFYDQQLFCADPLQPTSQLGDPLPRGQIKLRFEIENGLGLDQSTLGRPFMKYAQVADWYPTGNADTVDDPNGLFPGKILEYIFDFNTTNPNSHSFATYGQFIEFMNFSEIRYLLYPVCDSTTREPARYTLKVYINPLPVQHSGNQCTSCFIPLAQTGGDIHINCPGCVTPGIEADQFSLYRLEDSYGYMDSDNDGLADDDSTTGAVVPITAQNMPVGVRRNAAIAGDNLQATLRGVFYDGQNNSHHDLSYATWLTTWQVPTFTYLYAEQKILYAVEFGLTPYYSQITIRRNDTDLFTMGIPVPVQFGDNFFYKLPITFIQGLHPSYDFLPLDQFIIETQYKVCNNYRKPPLTNTEASDNYFDGDPANWMYFSNIDLTGPSFGGIYNTAIDYYQHLCDEDTPPGEENPPLKECDYQADVLRPDSLLFFCGGFGNPFRFYSVRTTNLDSWGTMPTDVFCDRDVRLNTYTNIGGSSSNVFPYEFRPPFKSFPNPQFTVDIPAGLEAHSGTYGTYYHTFMPGCSEFNKRFAEKKLDFAVPLTGMNNLYQPQWEFAREHLFTTWPLCCECGDRDYAKMIIGDEFCNQYFNLHLNPICSAQDCYAPIFPANSKANLYNYSCTSIPQRDSIKTFTLTDNQANGATGSLEIPFDGTGQGCHTNVLTLTVPGTLVVRSNPVKFSVSLVNQSFYPSPFTLPNCWLFLEDNQLLTVTKVELNNSSSPGCPLPLTLPDTNNFIEIGDIPSGYFSVQTCNYDITAIYACTGDPGVHDLKINYGWYCGIYPNGRFNHQYPKNLNDDICSGYEQDTIKFSENEVNFQVNNSTIPPVPSYTNCLPVTLQACAISHLGGGVNHIVANLDLPPNLILDPLSIKAAVNNSNNWQDIPAVDVSEIPLGSRHFKISLSSVDNSLDPVNHLSYLYSGAYICIKYDVIPLCSYSGNQKPVFSFSATDYCNQPVATSTQPYTTPWVPNGNACTNSCTGTASFQYSVNNCQYTFTQLANCTTCLGLTPYYSWDFGDSTTSTLPNPVHTYASNGSRLVKLTVTYSNTPARQNCCTVGTSQNIQVSCNPFSVSITASPSICSHPITLTAHVTGGDGSEVYTWSPSGSGPSITFTPMLQQSTYTYTVTVTGNIGTATASITISGNFVPLQVSTNIIDDNIVVTPGGGTAPYTYYWNNTVGTDVLPCPTPGTYTVLVTDANGCTGSKTIQIGTPVPDFEITTRSCEVYFQAGGTICEDPSYTWDFGDGSPSSYGKDVMHHYSSGGNFTVCLYVNCCGTLYHHCEQVQVGNCQNLCFTNPEFFITNDCGNFTFSNMTYSSPGGTVTYLWDFGDGNVSTAVSPVHSYAGNYLDTPLQVCLTSFIAHLPDSSNCSADTCVELIPSIADVCKYYCSYTQGFYGNANSHTCDGSTSSMNLLQTLLATPLQSGYGNRTVTIAPSEVNCLQDRLPGGSTPSVISIGNNNCATTPDIQGSGRFNSVLLSQTITLGLNLRLSPALNLLQIEDEYMTTYELTNCLVGVPVSASQLVFHFPQSVLNYLGTNNTVADLLTLANLALGNQAPGPSLGDITAAVDAINKGFDKCRILAGFSDNSTPLPMSRTGFNVSQKGQVVKIIPNPNSGLFNLRIYSLKETEATVEILNTYGQLIAQSEIKVAERENNFLYDLSVYPRGFYFIRISNGEESEMLKLVLQ